MQNSFTPKASDLFNIGYNVLPSFNGEKHPSVFWTEYQTKKVDEEINQWAKKKPTMWLLMCGQKNYSAAPGLIVIEGDNPEAVSYIKQHCPTTPLMVYSKRGIHFYYRRPITDQYIPNKAGWKIEGLDIRGDRGVVVAPGSISNSGHVYTSSAPITVETIQSLPVFDPAWLDLVTSPTPVDQPRDKKAYEKLIETQPMPVEGQKLTLAVKAAQDWLEGQIGCVVGQGAGVRCLEIARTLLTGFLLPPDTAFDLLYDWGQRDDQLDDMGNPYPWSVKDITHKLEECQKFDYRGTPGDMIVDLVTQSNWESDTAAAATAPDFDAEWGVVTTKKKKAYQLYRPANLPDEDVEWQIEEHFPSNSTVTLFGASGSGKSFYAIDMASSIATGTKFLGKYEVMKGNVLYICSEGSYGIKRRIRVWANGHNTTYPHDFLVSTTSHNLQDDEENQELIDRATAELGKIDIIFIDTLSRNFGAGDTDKNQDMQGYLASVDRIREKAKCTIVNIHHTGWSDAERERGAKSLRDYSDSSICISQASDQIKAHCKKQKEAPEFSPYTLDKIPNCGSIYLQLSVQKPQEKVDQSGTFLEHIPLLNGWQDEQGQGITIQEFGDKTGLKRTTATRRLNELVADGHVVRIEPALITDPIRFVQVVKN